MLARICRIEHLPCRSCQYSPICELEVRLRHGYRLSVGSGQIPVQVKDQA
jgi:hypothetical protein